MAIATPTAAARANTDLPVSAIIIAAFALKGAIDEVVIEADAINVEAL